MEDTQRKSPVKCMEDAHTHRTWRMRAVLDIGHTEDETRHCMEDMFKHTGLGECEQSLNVGHTRDKTCQCIVDTQTQGLEDESSLETEGMRPFNVRRIQHTHRTSRMGADITQRT